MTRSETLKKHWYGPVVIGLGVMGSLYAWDMVPWIPRAGAATKVELTEKIAAADNAAFARDRALILRIEHTDSRVDNTNKAVDDFITEQRKFNRRQERRYDHIIENTRRP